MLQTLYASNTLFFIEVTHNNILTSLLLIKEIRNFKVIELPLNIVQLNLYSAKYVFTQWNTIRGWEVSISKVAKKTSHMQIQL